MARLIAAAVVLVVAVVFVSSTAARSEFEKENVIRSVTDRVGSLEQSLLQVLGRSRDALHFARFARR